ncbi:hypothetical protein [Parapedobacter indicus]|uniref:Uncharacterized protein n=1 Tax=Parapedobacter indicus TaxID=1477437 RepID=A0A1I3CPT7_9SPHI|nr:hypothetical protein [Parapedobacter indicus]PPL04346.1 hypothetical protein CLV26_101147 [Parapedobacter indicus]SFH76545.1 hypothetical protein SAMN05444682_101134 [Parapedobacter indicus]
MAAQNKLTQEILDELLATDEKSALDEGYIDAKTGEELSDFQNYLLDGPIMDADQYSQFKENRKHLST